MRRRVLEDQAFPRWRWGSAVCLGRRTGTVVAHPPQTRHGPGAGLAATLRHAGSVPGQRWT